MGITKEQLIKQELRVWRNVVNGTGIDHGTVKSPFCVMYLEGGCLGCPVQEHSGYTLCRGTDYSIWVRHHNQKHFNMEHPFKVHQGCDECHRLAMGVYRMLMALNKDKQ